MEILLLVIMISVITFAMTEDPIKGDVSNTTGASCDKTITRNNKVHPFTGGSDFAYMVKIVQRLHWTEIVVVSDQSEVLGSFLEYAEEAFIKLNIYNSMQTFIDDTFFHALHARNVLVFGTKGLQKNALQKILEIPGLFVPFSPLVVETFWLCLLDSDLLWVIDIGVLKIYHFAALLRSNDDSLSMLKTLVWTSEGRQFSSVTADISTLTTSILYPNVNFGLNGALLRVGINEWYPFIIAERNGKMNYTGYCIDLLEMYASSLNFSYELVLPLDKEFGDFANGRWTGLVGLIDRKEVDIAVSSLSASEQRQTVVDLAYPFEYMTEGITFKQDNQFNLRTAYFSAFTWEVYACILGSFVFSAVILLSVHAACCWLQGEPVQLCVPEVVQFLFGSLLNQDTSSNWTFGLTRFLALCWCLMALVLTSSFTGMLTSLLVSVPAPLPFTSLAELAANDDFRVGVTGGSRMNLQLRTSKDPTLQTLYSKLMAIAKGDPDVLSRYQHVHQKKILAGRYAFIGDASVLENKEASMMDDVKFIPVYKGRITLNVHLPKNSSLKHMIGDTTMNLEEMGFLAFLRKLWFKSGRHENKPSSPSKVTFQAVQGPLYVACGGLFLAGLIALVEKKLAAARTKPFCCMKAASVSDA